MKNRIKVTAPTIRTRAQAEAAVREIAEITLRRNETQTEMDQQITDIRSQYESVLSETKQQLAEKTELLSNWAEANPTEFNGLKSLDLVHGVIGWRIGQPTLKTLAGWTWDRVLEKLKTLEWGLRFVRTKEEVNKQSILSEREVLEGDCLRIIGVKVTQEEAFFIEPKIEAISNRQEAA